MTKKLKVGLVGLGGIANVHGRGWAAAEHAELVAGSDVNTAVFPRWQSEYGLQKTMVDPDEIFNDPEIDIIDICTPNNYHADSSDSGHGSGQTCHLREAIVFYPC